jgi:predicted PurR-regulated permease PerM
MFSLDDRAGNVVTTVALFMVAAAILYLARGAFFILVLSLLFAYLLEPIVTLVQKRSRLAQQNRTWAIAEVYLIAILLLGGLGYKLGPHLVAQIRNLNKAVPQIVEEPSNGKAAGGLLVGHSLSADQELRMRDLLARHHDSIAQVFERGATFAAYIAARATWLFAVPILAIFVLRDGRQMSVAIIEAAGRRGDQALVKRILQHVDTMLARYVRAQLALAGLSCVFYTVSILVLGFPYAIALGVLGGALEFLPAVGWIASAAAILMVGFLAHSHWIWMAGLLVVWRLALNYLISPRVMGDSLELQPLTVLFGLMVGAQVGGIAGVYLSVPAIAVLRIVWLECFSTPTSSTALSDRPFIQTKA